MPTFRYSALICKDPANGFHAIAVEHGAVGFGRNAHEARDDLREFLKWEHKTRTWENLPDFLDASLSWFTISVRPEYRMKERIHPCESTIDVKVPCVTGTRKSGQLTADLPLLGIRFDYTNPAELKDLVRRYTLQKLEGCSPQELSRFLPPTETELIEIAVRLPTKPAGTNQAQPPPPTLVRVAEPMGDRAVRKGFARAWGRETEVAELVRKLHGEKANVLLVGEGGVGKTTLLVDAVREAEKLAAKETETRRSRRFWLTSAGRLVAGMKYLGQWEERIEDVISELGEIGGVLCVERLLDLLRRGGLNPSNSIAAFLIPYLSRGEVRMTAEATPAELDACRRLLPGLADLFQIVPVRPFAPNEALTVIDKQLATAASGPGIEVERGTGERIVRLYRRFVPYAVFPGPASSFARELIEAQVRRGQKQVAPDDVMARFRSRTGLPEMLLRDELTLPRESVRDWFGQRVIEQPEACDAAADVVSTIKAGLTDPMRPPAVLLFCGPTGVGKTETAKALAEYLFGQGEDASRKPGEAARLVRLDMSEYAGFDAVARLIGPPHGDPGELVRRVRKEPFCVVLLDEIEKASAEVFDTLMGVFDEGRLTDQFGRVTDFRSAILIMTSNLGAGRSGGLGFASDGAPRYRDTAMKFFRPEFFNRMDSVVTFQPLGPNAVKSIARRELDGVCRRPGVAEVGIRVEWSERLVEHLASVGFDARYGARPLQRAVERQVVSPLARWLLANRIEQNRCVNADWDGTSVVFGT